MNAIKNQGDAQHSFPTHPILRTLPPTTLPTLPISIPLSSLPILSCCYCYQLTQPVAVHQVSQSVPDLLSQSLLLSASPPPPHCFPVSCFPLFDFPNFYFSTTIISYRLVWKIPTCSSLTPLSLLFSLSLTTFFFPCAFLLLLLVYLVLTRFPSFCHPSPPHPPPPPPPPPLGPSNLESQILLESPFDSLHLLSPLSSLCFFPSPW
ncbi:uncharacterized protein BO95DRAFT_43198 [Aspergillus brunneoviolaceus CBS 621.78]|uniref:Uncharacterized protein n=1 Tax=Aspergillus brunneoviolaceus CBS 621.78 TaxID=1450534 RepID=A0ACD1GH82_9EURO|nr:hypothetical protein BO95DRAFT_43198 [Aspergillus brunneoviolaceus CBS 621.78]RAH48612.1 hypothetical protein BO95DRAFT_43198 [Aspergillus brunneoviolaceus CBS 621.78]